MSNCATLFHSLALPVFALLSTNWRSHATPHTQQFSVTFNLFYIMKIEVPQNGKYCEQQKLKHAKIVCVCTLQNHQVLYLFNQTPQLLLFSAHFRVATIQGWLLYIWRRCLFIWKACRHPQWLDKVRTSMLWWLLDALYVHPLSPAVSCGNRSYNTNSPTVLTW